MTLQRWDDEDYNVQDSKIFALVKTKNKKKERERINLVKIRKREEKLGGK